MAARRLENKVDLIALLPAVKQPVLVLERERGPGHRFATRVAQYLPSGELRFVPGVGPTAYPDHEQIVAATLEFIGAGKASRSVAEVGPSGTAIILFADIADSTALTERLGDAAFREMARELDEALRRAIAASGGQAIEGKLLGDGVLATFGAAREAIACAIACHAAAANAGLALHAGIHAGDVLREDNSVYGGAVNIASRISNEAAAGETLVSDIVRGLARTSAGVTFEDRGERELKGVAEPVRVFAVRSE
jgi:class 3 adenylate cyclase